ncbi:exostosin family protein [Actinidia rufa]|uniref:Exostosin family protein n=1 Tax=Actinidia rufa TaxID=165716 RepID=A0A7J0FHL0_9ERIC|nr:exostosin family protein [Actinidia rufa]
MGERNGSSIGQKKSMFYLFSMTSILNSAPKSHGDNNPSITPRGSNLLKSSTWSVELKVFMYDLPPEFHFKLLDWKPEGKRVWPDIQTEVPEYPESTTQVKRMLYLSLSFSSLCYNRYSRVKPQEKRSNNKLLQEKLVKFLTAQEEWKRSGGRDHIILAHHPNSLLDARMMLWPATFILSDFGRYPSNVANVDKDVIAPYKHVIKTYVNDSSDFDSRPTLLYFQGAIYRKDGGFVRQELFYLLKDEKDVHLSFGSVQKDGIQKATQGMHSSKFCLNIAGDTPSSNRLFDAIASHCVPVIISDDIELPYEDVLDYSEFCIFVRSSDALKEKFLINLIRSIKREEWTRMWAKLKAVENFFEFQYPSKEGDAVQMIWQAVARKVPDIRMKIHRSRRFSRYNSAKDRGLRSAKLPINFAE